MRTEQQVFEFRGVDKFYLAEVLKDTEAEFLCTTPTHIPVQEVGKTVDSPSEAHYYDNKTLIIVDSEGPDNLALVVTPPVLELLTRIISKSFDPTTGMMVDSPRKNRYFALMYRTKGTDGGYRYVSRLKGKFSIPEETNQTENAGTDTTNTTLNYTGIYTNHEFVKGIYNEETETWEKSGVKGIVVDARYGLVDLSTFFNQIQTPDTITPAEDPEVAGIAVVPSTLSVKAGETAQLTSVLVPMGATGTVTWISSAETYATVDDTGEVTALEAGSTTITATCGGFSDTCAVTVTAADA